MAYEKKYNYKLQPFLNPSLYKQQYKHEII